MRSSESSPCRILPILHLPERNLFITSLCSPHLSLAKLDKHRANSFPQVDVETQHQPTHHREHDGHQEIHKEGHECPADEGDHHDDDDGHLGHQPWEEEAPVVENATKHQHQTEEEMNHGAAYQASQEHPVMKVHPPHPPPHNLGNLQYRTLLDQQL